MRPSHAPARPSASSRASRPRRAAALAVACLALGAAGGMPAVAASPEPDPFPTVETWIDALPEIPPDAPPGAPVTVGVTLWDTRNRALFPVDGLVVKLYPAKGNGEPSTVRATQDAPGHLVAE